VRDTFSKSIRPNGTPDKNWSPGLIANNRIRAADLHFEWVALGFTAKSFWAVPGSRVLREIAELESR
jgi:hypothetical protein